MFTDLPRARQIAWAAGLFEGEGSVGVYDRSEPGRSDLQSRMSLRMNDEDVVRRFQAVVNVGKVYGPYVNESGNNYWNWQCAGWLPMKQVYAMFKPYLGKRRLSKFVDTLEQEPDPWHWVPGYKKRSKYGLIFEVPGHWRRFRV